MVPIAMPSPFQRLGSKPRHPGRWLSCYERSSRRTSCDSDDRGAATSLHSNGSSGGERVTPWSVIGSS